MGLTNQERINFNSKVLAANVQDGTPSKQWYESLRPNFFILEDGQVLTEFSLVRSFPAASLSTARSNVSSNLVGIVEDLSQFTSAVRLTEDIASNGFQYIALTTYNDFSSARLDKWIQPQKVPQSNGQPSIGYSIQLYDGDPASGGTLINTSDGQTGSGNTASVGWIFNYDTGTLLLSEDFKGSISDPYVVGFRYIGDTVADIEGGGGTGGDTERYYFYTTQTSHGYPVGSQLVPTYKTTTSGWLPAQANSTDTLAVGFITNAPDADTLEITLNGRVTVSGHSLLEQEYYFLSVADAGKVTSDTPISGVIQPTLWVEDPDVVIIKLERPNVLEEEPAEVLLRIQSSEIAISGLEIEVTDLQDRTTVLENTAIQGGSTSPGQVSFFSDSETITGVDELHWNNTSQILTVDGDISITGDVDGRDISLDGAALDTHTTDNTIHYTQANIDHTTIQNKGTNTHNQIDTHISDSTLHYLQTTINHTNLLNKGTNTHAQIDSHVSDATIHFTNLNDLSDVSVPTVVSGEVLVYDGNDWINGTNVIDHGELTGKIDDDHPQYFLTNGTRTLSGNITLDGYLAMKEISAPTNIGGYGLLYVKSDNHLYFKDEAGSETNITNSVTDHGNLTGKDDDDHLQYALLDGRSGGQELIGGTGSGDNLTLESTSDATKGEVIVPGVMSIVGQSDTEQLIVKQSASQTPEVNKSFSIQDDGGTELIGIDATIDSLYIGTDNATGRTTGYQNVLIGNKAGKSITSATFQVAIGNEALENVVTNQQAGNVAIGYRAGRNLVSAYSVAIGSYALQNHNAAQGSNFALGSQALSSCTTGASSVAIGRSAGAGLTLAQDTILIGNYAAFTLAGGSSYRNVFIGSNTAFYITGASENVFIGHKAGFNAISPTGNVLIGFQSGYELTTGRYNVLLGRQAAGTLTTGYYNIIIGNETDVSAAGISNELNIGDFIKGSMVSDAIELVAGSTAARVQLGGTTSDYPSIKRGGTGVHFRLADDSDFTSFTCAGMYVYDEATISGVVTIVGQSDTEHLIVKQSASQTQANKSFSIQDDDGTELLGIDANVYGNSLYIGTDNATGDTGSDFNILIGTRAGKSITSADFQVAIGYEALENVIDNTAAGNVAIGYRAGRSLMSAYNVAIGSYALQNHNTTGSTGANFALGSQALSSCTTGAGNVAIGQVAAGGLTLSVETIAIGNYAAWGSAGGSSYYNVFIGGQAGFNITGAQENVFIGHASGQGGISPVGNVLVGSESGKVITTGRYNVLLGRKVAGTLTTGYYNIIIGHEIDVSAAGVSNELNIGDFIKGSMVSDAIELVAGSTAARVQLGGTTSDYPSIKRGGTGVHFRLADDSDFTSFTCAGMYVYDEATISGVVTIVGQSDTEQLIVKQSASQTLANKSFSIQDDGGTELIGIDATADSLFIGTDNATGHTTSNFNVLIGNKAGKSITSADFQVAIGYEALENVIDNNGAANVAIGYRAGRNLMSGFNVAIGSRALRDHNAAQGGNFALGSAALIQCTTGSGNVAIGQNALAGPDLADNNVAIGNYAMWSVAGAALSRNVAIGSLAGFSLIDQARENVFIGYDAGKSATRVVRNICVGYRSALELTTGDDNVLLGSHVAGTLTTGSYNIIIGKSIDVSAAGVSNELNIGDFIKGSMVGDAIELVAGSTAARVQLGGTTSDYPSIKRGGTGVHFRLADDSDFTSFTCAGMYVYDEATISGVVTIVGQSDTEHLIVKQSASQTLANKSFSIQDDGGTELIGIDATADSLFIGTDNATNSTTAFKNVLIGTRAGESITSSHSNVAIGYESLQSLQDASTVGNVAIGYRTLKNCTDSYNVAIGFQALTNATIAGGNFGLGVGALQSLTTGDSNIAIGLSSMSGISTGDFNVAIGSYAAYNMTPGATSVAKNIFIGASSGFRISSNADSNVFIGYNCGVFATSLNNNTYIGYAGGFNTTTGSKNTYIGSSCGNSTTTGSYNIAIGYNIDVSAAGVSNELNIGDFIKGSMVSDAIELVAGSTAARVQLGGTTSDYPSIKRGGTGVHFRLADDSDFTSFTCAGMYVYDEATISGVVTIVGQSDTEQLIVKQSASQTPANKSFSIQDDGGTELVGIDANTSSLFIGTDNATNSTTAHQNVLIGTRAGKSITSAGYNVAIGYEALEDNSTHDSNVAIGFRASRNVVSTYNVAIGPYALQNHNDASAGSNFALGSLALGSCTTGSGNVAIGRNALVAPDLAESNVAIGNSAMYSVAGAALYKNVAIGGLAGYNLIDQARENVFIGYAAGRYATSVVRNICIGYASALGLTTGDYNVLLGDNVAGTLTTGSYNIIIGKSIDVSAAGVSNELNIGDFIKGSMVSDAIELVAGSTAARVQLGGTTSSYPSIKRDDTGVHFRLADDSDFTSFTAKTGTFEEYIALNEVSTPTTVSGYGMLYVKSDSHLYFKDEAGSETNISSTTGNVDGGNFIDSHVGGGDIDGGSF